LHFSVLTDAPTASSTAYSSQEVERRFEMADQSEPVRGRGAPSTCPYCGQSLKGEKAVQRLIYSEHRLAQGLPVGVPDAEEVPFESGDAGETAPDAARQAHDMRVGTRIF
jgi:hypothetical protein